MSISVEAARSSKLQQFCFFFFLFSFGGGSVYNNDDDNGRVTQKGHPLSAARRENKSHTNMRCKSPSPPHWLVTQHGVISDNSPYLITRHAATFTTGDDVSARATYDTRPPSGGYESMVLVTSIDPHLTAHRTSVCIPKSIPTDRAGALHALIPTSLEASTTASQTPMKPTVSSRLFVQNHINLASCSVPNSIFAFVIVVNSGETPPSFQSGLDAGGCPWH